MYIYMYMDIQALVYVIHVHVTHPLYSPQYFILLPQSYMV